MATESDPKEKDQSTDPQKIRPVPVTGTDDDTEKEKRSQQDDKGWHKRERAGDSADEGDNADDAGRVTGERDPVEDSPDDSPEG